MNSTLTKEGHTFSNTEPKRVKVYILENNEWKDTGTGFCIGEVTTIETSPEVDSKTTESVEERKEAHLVVSDEEYPSNILLHSKLEGNIEYQRQEETLIVWKDLLGQDIALSFEESLGCDRLCDFIVQVQRHIEENISLVAVRSGDDGIGSVHEIITGPVTLPLIGEPQNTETLFEALRIFNENTAYEYLKNETVEFVLQNDYISLLIGYFKTAEQKKELKDLFLISNIVKSLILYNQRDILEQMVDDEHIMGVVGILEYDTEFPTMKANHREYLKLDAPTFKEILPLENQDFKMIVKKCFRLQFLKDVVLVRFLDDHNFSLFQDIILDLETCIIDVLEQEPFLANILALYNLSKDDEKLYEDIQGKKNDGIKLIHQCVQMSKNLEDRDKTKFYKALVTMGLFNVLSYAFNVVTDPTLRILATDTIVTIIEHDILLVHNVAYKKQKSDPKKKGSLSQEQNDEVDTDMDEKISDNMKFLMILSKILLSDKSPGLREQIVQALNTLLHPEGCFSSLDSDMENMGAGSMLNEFNYRLNSERDNNFNSSTSMNECLDDGDINSSIESVEKDQEFQLNEYFNNFYKQVAPVLFAPLMLGDVISDEKSQTDAYDDYLLIHLVKLISFIATEHTRISSRRFILESHILKNVCALVKPTHILQLRLTALRCIKNIICLDDKYYHRYLMTNNLYDNIFELLKENMKSDNLANSCIQDLFKLIAHRCNISHIENSNIEELRQQTGVKISKKSNFSSLNKYLWNRFGDVLRELPNVSAVNDMWDFYENKSKEAKCIPHSLNDHMLSKISTGEDDEDIDISMTLSEKPIDDVMNGTDGRKRVHSDIE